MRPYQIAILAATFLLLYIFWALFSGPRVHLTVYPRISSAPATIRIDVSVEPAENQRSIRVEAESGRAYRASEADLEGLQGPRTTHFDWRDMESGEYVLTAIVRGADRQALGRARQTFIIIGREQLVYP